MTLQEVDYSQQVGSAVGVAARQTAPKNREPQGFPISAEEAIFKQLTEALGNHLASRSETAFTVVLSGEESQFTRFSSARVRQTGQVKDGQMRLTLMTGDRTAAITLPFCGDFSTDWPLVQASVDQLMEELPSLPADPYLVMPTLSQHSNPQTREVHSGRLLPQTAIANTLLSPVQGLDFAGLYAGGRAYRAYADSAGKQHWFETPSFTLDYSLFGSHANQAVKGTLAGRHWAEQDYLQNIVATQAQLERLSQPAMSLPRGCYRTYLAPAAVADIIDTIIWGGGLGEASLRQGSSAFEKLEQGEAQLSEKFSLGEDFQRMGLPRFNDSGEISPAQLPIIHQGQWVNSLVNSRSAKEYGKRSNGANKDESMRAPTVAPGQLKEAEILSTLDTGLYVSNLHYLNWSDLSAGRMTGMTRYACFWIEGGELVAPIENLRFDDNLYRFLGEGLVDLTCQQTFLPAVGTYDRRSLGGMWMPGMLIDQFRYTL
ncbi:MAG: metallopeptidase TldD-related protein [Cyanobacteria bacterium J06607_13]